MAYNILIYEWQIKEVVKWKIETKTKNYLDCPKSHRTFVVTETNSIGLTHMTSCFLG